MTAAANASTHAPPRFLRRGDVARAWRERLTPRVTAMLRGCDSIVLATADADGHPYVQHRGGPPGWLHVLTIAPSRLPTSPATASTRRSPTSPRIRRPSCCSSTTSVGTGSRSPAARASPTTPISIATLTPRDYSAVVERAIVFDVSAWSANCPQHIPRRVAQLMP